MLPFTGSPALPNQFGTNVPYDANLTRPWTLTFKNGTDSKVIITLSAQGVTALPYATSVTLSGSSANPTFAWSYPAGSVDGVFFDIFDRSNPSANGGAGLVSTHSLPGTTNSFTVPDQLAGGLTFQQGHQYTLDLYGVVTLNQTASPLNNARSKAWLEVYYNFTPLPAGSPLVNLPTVTPDGAFQYQMVVVGGQLYYLDPAVTTGYDFSIGSGNPNFASVLLPAVQSSPFDVSFLEGGTTVTDLVAPGGSLTFPSGGVFEFKVTGIDPSLGIDPTDTTAFITGVTFVASGTFDGLQTPITTDVSPPTATPEPATGILLATGLVGFAIKRRAWVC